MSSNHAPLALSPIIVLGSVLHLNGDRGVQGFVVS